ncbi:hypothetical protein H0484_01840 [Pusillimonas sp. CC-YST705]|uniref:Uncharacterized protein n=1 Tax=Mesopusillimonas faecipullorum TaxID=2755040 RepID=A0ABS8C8Z0_9BURK|nr:hypothetical protein [Mesopusillimonas faecipullorum]MCB5362498.1 hypothetical protein [Mesopusillimonas faecipullorum]
MSTSPSAPLVFNQEESDLIGRTADALSAYLGKPVLAEIIDATESGFEWVVFAVPLEEGDDEQDMATVQVGGADGRLVGQKGGLELEDGASYHCQYLWAIQLTEMEGARFIKLDGEGEEIGWSDDLAALLPFALNDTLPEWADEDEDDEDGEDSDDTRKS